MLTSVCQGPSSRRLGWVGPSMIVMTGLLCMASGCGGSAGGSVKRNPEQAAISGSIVFNGSPVPVDSQVTFTDPDQNAVAVGRTDSLGKFSLSAADKQRGIPAGRYLVNISPKSTPMSEAEYEQMMRSGVMPAVPEVKEIPQKFRSALTSKLVFQVKQGPNTFDLDLAKL